jgi:uncharacterized protein with PIN domain
VDIMARCPYCKKEVTFNDLIIVKEGIGYIRQERMYICPFCDCIIGISRGKYG